MVKELLVHVDASTRASVRIDLALNLARKLGALPTGMFAEIDTLGSSLVGHRTREDMDQAADSARLLFETSASRAGFTPRWWRLESGDSRHVTDLAIVCSRYSDLTVFGRHDPEYGRVPDDLVEQVVFACGRPVLVVPSVGSWSNVGQRVVIAWDGSRESARATHDAIPLMLDAKTVVLLAFQRPIASSAQGPLPHLDIAAHLQAHGIDARYERVLVQEQEIGVADIVLNRCADLGADLIVMGARKLQNLPLPHSGGTLREVLGALTAPILLSC